MKESDKYKYDKAKKHGQKVTQKSIMEKRLLRRTYSATPSLEDVCTKKKKEFDKKIETILYNRFQYALAYSKNPAHGTDTFCLSSDSNFAYRYNQYQGDRYSNKCTYRILITDRYLSIPAGSRRPALDVCDNIPNLAAKKIHTIRNCDVYAAIWLQNAKGFDCKIVNGFIAKKGDLTYHATTIKKAVLGVLKKENRTSVPTKITLETRMTRRLYHAITGACYVGIDDFLARHNISYKSMTVKDLLPFLEKTETWGLSVLKKNISV
jgi:hypothetical protein